MRVFIFVIALALCLYVTRTEAATSCGKKKRVVQQLIRQGYKALEGAWPWHGALFHRYTGGALKYACGVTILTEQFVITVAHCTIDPHERQKLPARRVLIKVGVTNMRSPGRHVQEHFVDKIIRHEEYNEDKFEDDIALMRLNTDVTFNEFVQPICLWQGDTKLDKIVSQVGYIVGWGYDELGFPNDLNEATMRIVSRKECIASDESHYRKFYFELRTFCAGHRNGTQATPGDSGGGLFLRVGEHWVLRGIISTSKVDSMLNTDTESFVVFTDASYYDDWIKLHVTGTTSVEFNVEAIETPHSSRLLGDSGSQANLLNILSCGRDTYPSGTPEELKGYLNQYPWLAVIEYINMSTRMLEDTCHGVLIHPRFLVTAGNCVRSKRRSTILFVRLNDYQLDTVIDVFEINGQTISTTATRILVRDTFVHRNYNSPKFANNIALIKLDRPATAYPICLPKKGSTPPVDKTFTIVGWKKNSREEKPMIRNVVQLEDFSDCQSKYDSQNISLDSTGGQMCSSYSHEDDSEKCSHYMGSAPFQYVRDGPFEGQYFLVAISSFGNINCRRDKYPDVFTSVAHYADWIQQKVKENE